VYSVPLWWKKKEKFYHKDTKGTKKEINSVNSLCLCGGKRKIYLPQRHGEHEEEKQLGALCALVVKKERYFTKKTRQKTKLHKSCLISNSVLIQRVFFN